MKYRPFLCRTDRRTRNAPQGLRTDDKVELLSQALAALRELTLRSDDAFDQVADEDVWQSDEFSAAVERAKAVLARADALSA